MCPIDNIIFDIGNVLLEWSPLNIIAQCNVKTLYSENEVMSNVFKSDCWCQLNLGRITEEEAIEYLHHQYGFSQEYLLELFHKIKTSQKLINENIILLESLYRQKYKIYALSDNIKEVVSYLRSTYNFWKYFEAVTISSEVNMMKTDVKIFNYMLKKYKLNVDTTIFIDDHEPNIIIARELNIKTIHYKNSQQCKSELEAYGVRPL